MTFSEINNKLTNINSEDLLTSDIFGCCSFLNFDELLKYILKESMHFDSNDQLDTSEPVVSEEYIFWPRIKTGKTHTEPDVLIILQHPENKCSLILIEAKYSSGKSSEANYDTDEITDQLAKELRIIEEQELYTQFGFLEGKQIVSKALIYVTADDTIPRSSLYDSANEFIEKHRTNINYKEPAKLPLYWLPWWKIEHIATNTNIFDFEDKTKNRIIAHIKDVLQAKKLSRFSGFNKMDFDSSKYSYISEIEDYSHLRYGFSVIISQITYNYIEDKGIKEYNFSRMLPKISYNYHMRR
ncbi:hypothetical protein [Methanomethylovorans sp.]|uniref:hypothetical protein n=1 Tax=Methanomethylovorans sp. TaxID=2758717 RepID=UPI002FDE8F1B